MGDLGFSRIGSWRPRITCVSAGPVCAHRTAMGVFHAGERMPVTCITEDCDLGGKVKMKRVGSLGDATF